MRNVSGYLNRIEVLEGAYDNAARERDEAVGLLRVIACGVDEVFLGGQRHKEELISRNQMQVLAANWLAEHDKKENGNEHS